MTGFWSGPSHVWYLAVGERQLAGNNAGSLSAAAHQFGYSLIFKPGRMDADSRRKAAAEVGKRKVLAPSPQMLDMPVHDRTGSNDLCMPRS